MPHPRARASARTTAPGDHDEVEVFGTVGDFWSQARMRARSAAAAWSRLPWASLLALLRSR